ncbi:hypothetical protein AAG589_13350 [Isoptericola sp. F-RaC21]|uniref:hypothetical protein n=1 Tax=Isoptericola sp. F-RaC21 TaxID=3141452 RepID=UPI00315B560C
MQFLKRLATSAPGVVLVAALALSGAGLVVSIPVLFEPHGQRHELTTLLLAALVLVLAVVALRTRRNGTWPGRRAGDD